MPLPTPFLLRDPLAKCIHPRSSQRMEKDCFHRQILVEPWRGSCHFRHLMKGGEDVGMRQENVPALFEGWKVHQIPLKNRYNK
ncbi:hypothetical protein CEXT_218981 [Caerostris extrusa]|uniref:Uncharacterized protein n=1 Tax=Caerostris extrusa TaxID=172846 RepID=A0AAV4WWU2_CAEEX|nr:hypothetical protein CEXT_218981 [Caerostris extrusa]